MLFLRPEWFLLLIPLVGMAVLYWRGKRASRSWAAVIDARLLPHVLAGKRGRNARWPVILTLLIATLLVTALAGPAWQKREQPVFKQKSALVIALDLSVSMNAEDIRPSRLERARLKLIDLLKLRREGQTALIAYAASPFTVTPLTDDVDTITALLPSLTSDIMPAQGSRADLAVFKAMELFDNAGLMRGDILLVTDGINDTSLDSLSDRHMPDFRLSVLAIGTEEGAPVPAGNAGFVKDDNGAIVVARTDFAQLEALATAKGGQFQAMRIDDRDVQAIEAMLSSNVGLADHQQTQFKADRWREEGPWLLLLATPLVALAFRRGFILVVLLTLITLPLPRPVQAEASWWDRLWHNRNQLGEQALQQGNADAAVDLFRQPEWKAAAQYRAGRYQEALKAYEKGGAVEDLYNRGNTLVRLGDLPQAIQSYEQVLQQEPQHEDARHNLEVVRQALQNQQQGGDSERQNQQADEQQDQQQSQQNQEQDKQDQDNKDQQHDGQGDQQQDGQGDQQQDDSQQAHQGQQGGSQQQQQQDQAEQQRAERQAEGEQGAVPDQQQQQQDQAGEQQEQQAEAQRREDEQAENEQPEPQAQREMPPQPVEQAEQLSEQAEMQWLRRIPDDPGGLLRNKFRYQYSRQRSAIPENEPW